MKAILTAIALLSLAGCVPGDALRPEEQEQIYSHGVQLKKEAIRTMAIQFINEKFISGKAVTQAMEEGMVVGNGIVFVCNESFGIVTYNMELTFLVKYVDGQYKVKFVIKRLMATNNTTGRETEVSPEHWGGHRQEINAAVKKLDFEFFDYLSNKDDKFKF